MCFLKVNEGKRQPFLYDEFFPCSNMIGMDKKKIFIVGVTGASGALYAIKLLGELASREYDIHLIISDNAQKIIPYETSIEPQKLTRYATAIHQNTNSFSPLASGSFRHDGMIIVPCTMKTLASVAHGYADTLITRVALCTLKENRQLILVPRETPFGLASLENMVMAKKNGAVVLPAIPAFYHKPATIDNLIDYVVGKILDQLNIDHSLFTRWKEKP